MTITLSGLLFFIAILCAFSDHFAAACWLFVFAWFFKEPKK